MKTAPLEMALYAEACIDGEIYNVCEVPSGLFGRILRAFANAAPGIRALSIYYTVSPLIENDGKACLTLNLGR